MTPEEIRAKAPVGTTHEVVYATTEREPEPPDGWEYADGRIIEDPLSPRNGLAVENKRPSMQLPGYRSIWFEKVR